MQAVIIRSFTLYKFLAVNKASIKLLILSIGPIKVFIAIYFKLNTKLLKKFINVNIAGALGSKG